MTDVKQLNAVPELDQNAFPDLSKMVAERNWNNFFAYVLWGKAEVDYGVGTILTSCLRASGVWIPVHVDTVFQMLEELGSGFIAPGVLEQLGFMTEERYLEMVIVGGKDHYFVPTPQFAEKALSLQAVQLKYSIPTASSQNAGSKGQVS